jgi:7-cyano-7-deazaguanine synthase
VLLSGGIDSAVCLALKCANGARPIALSVDYGQRNRHELERAAQLAAHYRCEHMSAHLDMPWLATDGTGADGPSKDDTPRHYIPARNLIVLSIAMGLAESRDIDLVYLGATVDDWRYPDTRAPFIQAFNETIDAGLQRSREGRPVHVRTPLAGMRKSAVVRLAVELGVPLGLTWSCYEAGPVPCGHCGACVVRRDAFSSVGLSDPAFAGAASA